MKKAKPHPYERSRPGYAPSANRPAVTATSPIVCPSRVPVSSRVSDGWVTAVLDSIASSL